MITIRTFTMIAAAIIAAAAGSPALADTPAKPGDKPAPTDKPTDKPPARQTLSDAEAQKFVVFFEKLVTIAVDNQDDCARMATAFNAHIDANQALIKQAHEARSQGKELPPAVKQKLEGKTKDFQQALTKKCGNDKTVQAALMRIAPGKMDKDRMDKDRMDKDRMDKDRDKDRMDKDKK
jgi:hypothetical protein